MATSTERPYDNVTIRSPQPIPSPPSRSTPVVERVEERSTVLAPTGPRVRVILMNGLESEALRFSHVYARSVSTDLRLALARVRRVEHHQQTLVNWLNPADQSPLETTIGFEQVAIEVTASIALNEPDP